MTDSNTNAILRRIDDSVERVLARMRISTWIFCVLGVVVTILSACVVVQMIRTGQANTLAEANRSLAIDSNRIASEANQKAIENRARQDILDKQFTDYIQANINVWNKLQEDNANAEDVKRRGVKVPEPPEIRPPGVRRPRDEELDRLIRTVTATPAPTPKPVAQKKTGSSKRPKRTPTPKPWSWRDLFNSSHR